jgi:hypothetical protein
MDTSTWEAFEIFLRSLPREKSAQEVDEIEHRHDAERGPYAPHGTTVHHLPGESRH